MAARLYEILPDYAQAITGLREGCRQSLNRLINRVLRHHSQAVTRWIEDHPPSSDPLLRRATGLQQRQLQTQQVREEFSRPLLNLCCAWCFQREILAQFIQYGTHAAALQALSQGRVPAYAPGQLTREHRDQLLQKMAGGASTLRPEQAKRLRHLDDAKKAHFAALISRLEEIVLSTWDLERFHTAISALGRISNDLRVGLKDFYAEENALVRHGGSRYY